jgi:hypothetical protein
MSYYNRLKPAAVIATARAALTPSPCPVRAPSLLASVSPVSRACLTRFQDLRPQRAARRQPDL